MTNTFNLQITKKWGEVEKKRRTSTGRSPVLLKLIQCTSCKCLLKSARANMVNVPEFLELKILSQKAHTLSILHNTTWNGPFRANGFWTAIEERHAWFLTDPSLSLFKEEKDSGLCLYMKCVVHSTCFIQEIRQGVLMRSTFLMRRKPF